jgi:four helix bundle protein
MTYEQWEAQVPEDIRRDPLWRVEAYRFGLFLSDLAWPDAMKLLKHKLMSANANQLYRAASNISSNVSEGYSRSTAADRARFYEYALGSVRETRDWYYKGRRALPQKVVEHRIDISTRLIRLLITMVTNERRRGRRIRERETGESN